jgi:hypothetical protein
VNEYVFGQPPITLDQIMSSNKHVYLL